MDVYTLEVTPEEGEKLALADAKGRLQLALRNATDTETVLTKGATVKDTLASYRYATKRRSPPRGPRTLARYKSSKATRSVRRHSVNESEERGTCALCRDQGLNVQSFPVWF